MASSSPISDFEAIANLFTEQYYKVLHESPNTLHKFYSKNGNHFPEEERVTTILKLGYGGSIPEITKIVSENSYEGGVLVVVTGSLTKTDTVPQKFTQSFFLAPHHGIGWTGYYVLNDVFQLLDGIEDQNGEQLEEVAGKLDDLCVDSTDQASSDVAGSSEEKVAKQQEISIDEISQIEKQIQFLKTMVAEKEETISRFQIAFANIFKNIDVASMIIKHKLQSDLGPLWSELSLPNSIGEEDSVKQHEVNHAQENYVRDEANKIGNVKFRRNYPRQEEYVGAKASRLGNVRLENDYPVEDDYLQGLANKTRNVKFGRAYRRQEDYVGAMASGRGNVRSENDYPVEDDYLRVVANKTGNVKYRKAYHREEDYVGAEASGPANVRPERTKEDYLVHVTNKAGNVKHGRNNHKQENYVEAEANEPRERLEHDHSADENYVWAMASGTGNVRHERNLEEGDYYMETMISKQRRHH